MKNFIELTRTDSKKILVSLDCVTVIEEEMPVEGGPPKSSIHSHDGFKIAVTETYDEIKTLITASEQDPVPDTLVEIKDEIALIRIAMPESPL